MLYDISDYTTKNNFCQVDVGCLEFWWVELG